MGIYDASTIVPKLEANGSNFWKWDAAVAMYAKLHDMTDILSGARRRQRLVRVLVCRTVRQGS
jgi:hypothetical protein